MISDWLSSHGFGDALYLGVLDVASNCETEDGANDSDKPEDISLDDTFDTFLEEVVVRRAGSRITTNHIRTAWAARHGADPTADTIAGIHKTRVARLFRAHFSAPPGKRGRAGGEVAVLLGRLRCQSGRRRSIKCQAHTGGSSVSVPALITRAGMQLNASPRLVDLHFTDRFQAMQMCTVNAVHPCHTE